MYTLGVAQYMLNDVLYNQGAHINGYSICVFPLCVLENESISECYTGFSMTVVMRFSYPDNTVRNLGFVPLHNDGTGADWSRSHIAGRTAGCYNTYTNLSNIKQNPTQRNKCKRHAIQMYYE